MIMHGGMNSTGAWLRPRYALGDSPTSSVKRELNEPSDVQPTAKQASVTETPPRLSRVLARSIRRVMTQLDGLSPKGPLKLGDKGRPDRAPELARPGTASRGS